jgi:hypothetical protein
MGAAITHAEAAFQGLDMDDIEHIHKRQLARFLCHLERRGLLTPVLESEIKRGYGFAFDDVQKAINQQGETRNELPKPINN